MARVSYSRKKVKTSRGVKIEVKGKVVSDQPKVSKS